MSINLDEIQLVFPNGTQIPPAMMSYNMTSVFDDTGYVVGRCFDGVIDQSGMQTGCHSLGNLNGDGNPTITVQFPCEGGGVGEALSGIKVYNRRSCCHSRITDFMVRVLSPDGGVVATYQFNAAQTLYDIKLQKVTGCSSSGYEVVDGVCLPKCASSYTRDAVTQACELDCASLQETYGIVPGSSWGSLADESLKTLWDSALCGSKICKRLREKYSATGGAYLGSMPEGLKAGWSWERPAALGGPATCDRMAAEAIVPPRGASNPVGTQVDFSFRCPKGAFLTGIAGSHGNFMSGIGPANCSDGTALSNSYGTVSTTWTLSAGGFIGATYQTSGVVIGFLDIVLPDSSGRRFGGDTGNLMGTQSCPEGWVVVGLFGQFSAGTGVAKVGLACESPATIAGVSCTSNPTVCGDHGTCSNIVGGYSCTCSAGWAFNGVTCVDVNECNNATICGGHGTCSNIAGGYNCSCSAGWTFNGITCIDKCAGVTCQSQGQCQVPGVCGAATGVCSAATSVPDGNPCSAGGRGICTAGACKQDIPDLTWVVGPNTDYYGGGNVSGWNGWDQGLSLSACQATCQSTPGCVMFTHGNISNLCTSCCFLKSSVGVPSSSGGLTAYLPKALLNKDSDFPGNSLAGWDPLAAANQGMSLGQCNAKCRLTAGCVAYVYGGAAALSCTNCCFLKSAWGVGQPYRGLNVLRNTDVDACTITPPVCGGHGNCSNTTSGDYQCTCSPGWIFDGVTCADVNECTLNPPVCGRNGNCSNSDGGYSCSCAAGWSFNGSTCVDVNECTSNPTVCGAHGVCSNSVGGYSCSCSVGWRFNGVTCVDVNECTSTPPVCAGHGVCSNNAGGYSCSCAAGWTFNNVTCVDVNECAGSPAVCGVHGACTNTAGGYSCSCSPGWGFDGVTCVDVDDCTLNPPVCGGHGNCTNSVGGYSCVCAVGWSYNGVTCIDVNECDRHVSVCGAHGVCSNRAGGYTCNCSDGWTFDNVTCSDLDECAEGKHDCSAFAVCTNTLGGYNCSCKTGFAGNGTSCTDVDECAAETGLCGSGTLCVNTAGGFDCKDVDECAEGSHDCSPSAVCSNTVGSFECTCALGFQGDGHTCDDINECEVGSHDCSSHATCTNTVGGYNCTCDPGFEGNGTACADIDECAVGTHSCGATSSCINTPGSFQCDCGSGLYWDSAGGSCIDINECRLGTHRCGPHATCTNTVGGYDCTCDPGFEGNGTVCADVDECSTGAGGPCAPNATCTNNPGGFTCACRQGYTGDAMIKCTDVNECSSSDPSCHPNATCSNTAGGFNCTCGAGFAGDGVSSCKPRCTIKDGAFLRRGALAGATGNRAVVSSPEECCDLCREARGCAHFTYLKESGVCRLKANVDSLLDVQYKGAVSGSVMQAVGGGESLPTPVKGEGGRCSAVDWPGSPEGTWDWVTAQCIPLACQGDALEQQQLSKECQDAQCRWVVDVSDGMDLWTAPPCRGGSSLGRIKHDCLQVMATGTVLHNCTWDLRWPSWVEVVVADLNHSIAWLPMYTTNTQQSSDGPLFHLEKCDNSHCDYRNSTFYSGLAGRGRLFPRDTSRRLLAFLDEEPPDAADPAGAPIEITVLFHVVQPSRSSGITGAYVTDGQITKQVKILNDAFDGSGVTFKLPCKPRVKSCSSPVVDRARLTAANLYGAALTGGGDGERAAAERIWAAPAKGRAWNHNLTELRVVTNAMPWADRDPSADPSAPASPRRDNLSALGAFPWELRSDDAADMRRRLARHDMVVVDHDCMPDSYFPRFGESHPCGKAGLTGRPYEGYVLVREVARWLGLPDTFGLGSGLASYREGSRISLCGPQDDPDGVADTPGQWCPTNGCNGGGQQCHPDAVAVYKGSFNATDPRCSSEGAYPDPNNIMNYYWWRGGCSQVPTFTPGQKAFIRRAAAALRGRRPFGFAERNPLLPVLGDACGDGVAPESVNAVRFDASRGRCATFAACGRSGGLAVGGDALGRALCEGPAGSVRCCFPAWCKAAAPRAGKKGFCVADNAAECAKGRGALAPAAAGDAATGGCPVGALCCVPGLVSKLPVLGNAKRG